MTVTHIKTGFLDPICEGCKGKAIRGQRRLTWHHIIPKSEGGSDETRNLIRLCVTCHDGLHQHMNRLKSLRNPSAQRSYRMFTGPLAKSVQLDWLSKRVPAERESRP